MAYLLAHPGAVHAFMPYLEKETFQDLWRQDQYTCLTRFVTTHGLLPAPREFLALYARTSPILQKESVLTRIQVLRDLAALYQIETTPATRIEVGSWIAQRAIVQHAAELGSGADIIELVAKMQSSLSKISPLLSTGRAASVLPLSDRYLAELFDEEENGATDPFPTYFSRIDDVLEFRGLQRGQTGIMQGGTGRGKSIWLVNILKNSLEYGRRCLYFPLEGGEKLVARRLVRCVTGLGPKDEHTRRQKEDLMREWCRRYAIDESRSIITPIPPKKVTADGLRACVQTEASRWGKIDLVIVDYGDLVRPSSKYNEFRHGMEEVFTELVGLAEEEDVVVWSATQTNRKGRDADVVTLDHTSEAYSKFFSCTLGLSIAFTPGERESIPPRCRISIMKNRIGQDNLQFPFFADLARSRFWQDMDRRVLDISENPNQTTTGEGGAEPIRKKLDDGSTIRRRRASDELQPAV